MITRVDHIGIRTGTSQEVLEACYRFCVEVLGLVVDPNRPNFAVGGYWMNLVQDGRTVFQIHLIACGWADQAVGLDPTQRHVALAVTDLSEIQKRLETFFSRHRLDDGPAGKRIVATDPAGNTFEFVQETIV